jgi:transcriptional regulator with XRE-family HTH domain
MNPEDSLATPFPDDFRDRFRFARGELGLSQTELAERSGVCDRTLREFEKGGSVRAETFHALLETLNKERAKQDLEPIPIPGRRQHQPFEDWLEVPRANWNPIWDGPSSLLRPEYRVVRFHGEARTREVLNLIQWCSDAEKLAFQVYTGPGGIGKTRLGIQLCDQLREAKAAVWQLGFLNETKLREDRDPWANLPLEGKRLLVVVDYAADPKKAPFILHILRNLERCPATHVRILFLEREQLWLGRLMGDSIAGKLFSKSRFDRDRFHLQLPPVAPSVYEREDSFRIASEHFARRLGRPKPKYAGLRLDSSAYNQVLLLHAQALLNVFGKSRAAGEASILGGFLARERAYWQRLAEARGLDWSLGPAIEQACHAITLNGGVDSVATGVALCVEEPLLADLPRVIVHGIVELLRECYPGQGAGIAALQPDLLAQYLIACGIRRKRSKRKGGSSK